MFKIDGRLKLKKKLLSIWILILGLSLVFNYTFNFSRYWLGHQTNNYFLDIAFSAGNIVVILISGYTIFKKFDFNQVFLFLFIILQVFWIKINGQLNFYSSIWHLILSLSHLVLWLNFLICYYNSKSINKITKIVFGSIILLYCTIDYFLVVDSQILLLIYFCWVVSRNLDLISYQARKLFILFPGFFLILNLFIGIAQTIRGKSVGLKYLGEINLNLLDNLSAKQEIFNWKILRPYGLTAHPNILGFMAVLILFGIKSQIIPKLNRTYSNLLEIVSLSLVLISLSRAAWISAILIYLVYIPYNLNLKLSFKNKYNLSLIFVSFVTFGMLFWQRLNNSDVFRFQNLNSAVELFSKLNIENQIFGLGLGQYTFYLQKYFEPTLWNYVPVHNLFVLLFLELGLINILLICAYLFLKFRVGKLHV